MALAALVILYFFSPEPPSEAIKTSRAAIQKAKKAGAGHYAPETLRKTEKYYQEALAEWEKQNNTWSLNRDFTRLQELIEHSRKSAEKAHQESIEVKEALQTESGKLLKELQKSLAETPSFYNKLPLPQNIFKKHSQTQILLTEARNNIQSENYRKAVTQLQTAREYHALYQEYAGNLLKEYFASQSQWNQWLKETIQWSRNHPGPAIIVDKIAHTCMIYEKGKLIRTFHAELGRNWIGQKLYQGDQATPEGKYHVNKKQNLGSSKYHKALLINYPNPSDTERFRQNKAKGVIQKNARIGGLIEIHGGGGQGNNWTEGCIALENKDIDHLFSRCTVGTPVTIIGSARPLEEILQQDNAAGPSPR